MKKQGRYRNEFKDEVLRMAEMTDKSLSELEQGLGLTDAWVNPQVAAALIRSDR